MKISVVCSSTEHPIHSHLQRWVDRCRATHQIELVTEASRLTGGDLLFLISCSAIIRADVRSKYLHTLVVHASDLPKGRGWSPHIWQILEGSNAIVVSLLQAEDQVDTGALWGQRLLQFEGHELYDEINAKLFAATLELMDLAVENFTTLVPRPQPDEQPTYYRKRTPEDSRLDPHKTLAEQFDLLRVADSERFPCFFEYRGRRYRVHLRKED